MELARATLRRLDEWGNASDWTGTDPYDGLNARRLDAAFRRTRRGRQVLTQIVKRSPVDVRPLLAVPPGRDAAAVANVVSAYALDEETETGHLQEMLDVLESLRCEGFAEPCWGYHFDVQTRIFFYPRGAPNTIATAFAGLALLDAYERTREPRLLELAGRVADFFLERVPQTATPSGAYFGYLVGDRTPIHNANMLVSALLARVDAHAPRNELADAAAAGVQYTLEHQRSDGSWPYAERSGWDWVDGYHTGYILDALGICVDLRVTTADADALDRGLRFYARALFLADGTPRFTATSTYPIDIQCVAQGIQTPALAATRIPELGNLAWSVFRFARARMLRRDGAFAYQRRRFWTNRTPHVRWAAAPMLLALTHLVRMGTTE
jgi:polysaccharide biosynthesis protein VpsJ